MVLVTEGPLDSSKQDGALQLYKVSGKCISMHLKQGYSLPLHSNNFGLKQLSTTVKKFHY